MGANESTTTIGANGSTDEIISMCETVEKRPDDKYPIIIRVFGGGEYSMQTQQLQYALSSLGLNQSLYKLEVMTCDMVNMNHVSLEEVITWLLGSHIHIISAHLHQGISLENLTTQGKSWDLQYYHQQINRLKFHPGFPTGSFLDCPVFLQDKYEYLRHLNPGGYCNPTFKFDRTDSSSSFDVQILSLRMFTEVVPNEDCGWIAKLPFVTNRKPFFTKSIDRLFTYLYNWVFKSDSAIVYPYIMIQPCLSNKREYKVVTIPSQNIVYIANAKGSGYAYSTAPHERILNFAKDTVQNFKSRCPNAITHQVFRVDILQTQDNKLVVNEFESIDANFVPNFGRTNQPNIASLEFQVKSFVEKFWRDELLSFEIIQECIVKTTEIGDQL